MSRRTDRIRQGASIGAVGAVSAFAIEAIVRRVPALAENIVTRSALRLALGAGGAALADSADASDEVTAGIFAGPVFSSLLDVGGALMRASRGGAPAVRRPVIALAPTWSNPIASETGTATARVVPFPAITQAQMDEVLRQTEVEMARRDAARPAPLPVDVT